MVATTVFAGRIKIGSHSFNVVVDPRVPDGIAVPDFETYGRLVVATQRQALVPEARLTAETPTPQAEQNGRRGNKPRFWRTGPSQAEVAKAMEARGSLLSARQRTLVEQRYGLNRKRATSMADLAARHGLSRGTVFGELRAAKKALRLTKPAHIRDAG
jgi:hypothetical protein